MAYWWVNQNQTWKHEVEGGYLWSPKRNRNGNRNQFYENMRLAEPGDRVFSYFNQRIQYIGVVLRSAFPTAKPSEFGSAGEYWSNEGWTVPVSWLQVSTPFRPKELIGLLRPHLPNKYSPLDQNGDGLQSVYLAKVPGPMADILLSKIDTGLLEQSNGILVEASEDEVAKEIDDNLEAVIKNDTKIDETERLALVNARRGQGKYRKNLEEIEKCCRVTGVSDRRLLRASHIKPWRSCANNHERLDGYNGLLLAPHIDHLFDRGYVSFTNEGGLLISSRIDIEQYERLGIKLPIIVGDFTDEQQTYMAYHREQVFRP